MRLIDTMTLKLQMFEKGIPQYAILSHTWGPHEINLQEFTGDHSKLTPEQKAGGLHKIQKFCAQALADGYQYAWCDTCCIDKANSTELSESLNLMFDWYRDATVCYAYLSDVLEDEDPLAPNSAFRKSRWFTRGWTLQELLAPLSLAFYGKNWIEIGTKASLMQAIREVTGIAAVVLLVSYPHEVSIGERLSWAAGRETFKVEDRAYSLLGLLQIKMPVLYGEGTYAFIRLQQELIKSSNDQTIFAWKGQQAPGSGMLAESPDAFRDFRGQDVKISKQISAYTVTNGGLNISLPLVPDEQDGVSVGVLNCKVSGSNLNEFYGVYLQRDKETGQYTRIRTDTLASKFLSEVEHLQPTSVYIKERVPSQFNVSNWMRSIPYWKFLIKGLPGAEHGFGFAETWVFYDKDKWSTVAGDQRELCLAYSGYNGALRFSNPQTKRWFAIVLGVHNYNVWSDIVVDTEDDTDPNEELGQIALSYYRSYGAKRVAQGDLMLDRVRKDMGGGKQVVLNVRRAHGNIDDDINWVVFVDIISK